MDGERVSASISIHLNLGRLTIAVGTFAVPSADAIALAEEFRKLAAQRLGIHIPLEDPCKDK